MDRDPIPKIYPRCHFQLHSIRMSTDDRTAQEKLTPEDRRTMLRALADRMLLKVSAMDDPEDLPGVEKTVRVAASIERIYYRCDRAEHHAPDPRKLEAKRATHKSEAIKARVSLAGTLEWGEKRQKQLGKWWDAAGTAALPPVPAPVVIPAAAPQPKPQAKPQIPTETPASQDVARSERPAPVFDESEPPVGVIDYAGIIKARAKMGLPYIPPEGIEDWLHRRPSPS